VGTSFSRNVNFLKWIPNMRSLDSQPKIPRKLKVSSLPNASLHECKDIRFMVKILKMK